jgi:hypothetical protein
MVEVGDPMSQFNWMVIWKEMAKRTEPYAHGPQECLSDQKIGSRARLPGSREVLTDPRFFEAQRVEPLKFLEIPTLASTDGPLRRVRRHE